MSREREEDGAQGTLEKAGISEKTEALEETETRDTERNGKRGIRIGIRAEKEKENTRSPIAVGKGAVRADGRLLRKSL